MNKASIFDIYRGTTHDGPGLRTTIFFKGCPLSCEWCHNPEGISPSQVVWWDSRSCIGCMLCHKACKTGAINPTENKIIIDNTLCEQCGSCIKACPSKAMTFVSKEWSIDDLVDEVMRDKVYYDNTGGGVTASGGECMMQHNFLADLFRELKKRNLNTAIDTCGSVPFSAFEKVLKYTDHVLYDLKILDNELHKKYTKQSNHLSLENVRLISKAIAEGRITSDLWIRTPLIPGATAEAENIKAIGRFIVQELNGAVSRWELCTFNNSCTLKYERLNLEWPYKDTPLLDNKTSQALRTAAIESGVDEDMVVLSGIMSSK